MIRLTDALRMHFANHSALRAGRELANATRSAAAGQRVLTPSDDPARYGGAIRRGAEIESLSARVRAARTSEAALELAERSLDAFGELIVKARELALQGANETLNASDRATLAAEVRRLREHAVSIANTRGPDGYLFGGTKTDAPPFDPGGAFSGNDIALFAPLGQNMALRANASGAMAFTVAGGTDAFVALSDLASALSANDALGARAAVDTIDAVHRQVTREQSDTGSRMARLESFGDVAESALLTMREWQVRDVGADETVEIVSRLEHAHASYERSLAVSRRILAALEKV